MEIWTSNCSSLPEWGKSGELGRVSLLWGSSHGLVERAGLKPVMPQVTCHWFDDLGHLFHLASVTSSYTVDVIARDRGIIRHVDCDPCTKPSSARERFLVIGHYCEFYWMYREMAISESLFQGAPCGLISIYWPCPRTGFFPLLIVIHFLKVLYHFLGGYSNGILGVLSGGDLETPLGPWLPTIVIPSCFCALDTPSNLAKLLNPSSKCS